MKWSDEKLLNEMWKSEGARALMEWRAHAKAANELELRIPPKPPTAVEFEKHLEEFWERVHEEERRSEERWKQRVPIIGGFILGALFMFVLATQCSGSLRLG